ncbi:hypothetical protein [Rhodococcus sp. H29-C3]|uniref:hypothetical protein n=1 Tax=Rhodococcus sp. H29-C3 TaxID=3046307 RepID=UPI0024B951AC|nr:hypothetical protein [Rhodococcus sp. H29-C3]MDJ0363144.1 hypothetical protein [Rhodococcus sp. H29-C3]
MSIKAAVAEMNWTAITCKTFECSRAVVPAKAFVDQNATPPSARTAARTDEPGARRDPVPVESGVPDGIAVVLSRFGKV